MNTWTLTISSSGRFNELTIIGAAERSDRARKQLFAAAAATIRTADIDERPRYTLQLGEQLAAILQAGDDDFGLPDHPGTSELLDAIEHTSPSPFDR